MSIQWNMHKAVHLVVYNNEKLQNHLCSVIGDRLNELYYIL